MKTRRKDPGDSKGGCRSPCAAGGGMWWEWKEIDGALGEGVATAGGGAGGPEC